MQYKIILSHTVGGGYEVSAPIIPHWRVSAQTRDEGIAKACKAIVDFMNRSELVSIEISATEANGREQDVPWEWFGIGVDDPSWDALFEEIEQNRDTNGPVNHTSFNPTIE